MSRLYTCPSCKKPVALGEIHNAVVDVNAAPEWWCARCKQAQPRENWGSSNDGIPATSYFFHGGPGKREPARHKLPRALVRNMTFAAHPFKRKKIHVAMPDDPHVGPGVDYETVALYHRTERYSLLGRYFTPSGGQPDKVALMLSGSGGTAHGHLSNVARRYCTRLDTAVLLIDYRGFGSSDRKAPSEQGLFTDAEMMYAFLTEGVEMGGLGWAPGKVVVHGYSLGTGVAAELAARKGRRVGGLVLQCPFTSAADMAGEVGFAPGRWLARKGSEFDVIGKVPGIERPILLLIAHGDTDMKDHGDAISIDTVQRRMTNVTVGRYDGTHHEPHNAFKDGQKFKVQETEGPGGRLIVQQTAQLAARGDKVIDNRSLPLVGGNTKTSKGQGCIGVISHWLQAF